jgi:formylglycine-generating enzyme required for sulfatase activity
MAVILIMGGIAWQVVGKSFFTPRQTEIPTNAMPVVSDLDDTNTPSINATEANFVLTNTAAPALIIETATQPSTSAVVDPSTVLTSTPVVSASQTLSASDPPSARDKRVNPIDGATFIYIPPGEFTLGLTAEQVLILQPLCTTQMCRELISKSYPDQQTKITRGYWIYRTEVSNSAYAKCLQATICTELQDNGINYTKDNYFESSGFADYPVVWVEWAQAKTYCEWAGGRLPTSAEWEYAARGTGGKLFPWGDATPTANHANVNSFYGELRSVNGFGDFPSPFGVLNMAGNVWEWVSDYYDSAYYTTNTDWVDPKGPAFPDDSDDRVVRGGSAWFSSAYASGGVQDSEDPVFLEGRKYYGVGFRCADSDDQP